MWTPGTGALRRELRAYADAAVVRLFVWTTTANTSKLGKEDAVATGDDDPKRGQRPVRRLEPFGLRSRPPAKMRSLSLRLGSSTVIYLGVASDGGYGPGDLEDGELALFSKNVPKALHAKDNGDVALASADGQTVSINGDDFKLPKWEGTGGFVAALNAFLDSAKIATTAGQIATAANTFRLAMTAASNFSSTKGTNG